MGCYDCEYHKGVIRQLRTENERLRKALKGLHGHTKNDMTICGLNYAAKQALTKEEDSG